MSPTSGIHRDRMSGVSRGAYGNAYLLEVAAAIADFGKDRFRQKDVVTATGLDKGLVALALKKLEAGDLIRRVAPEGRDHPFLRLESVYWANAQRHRAELDPDANT